MPIQRLVLCLLATWRLVSASDTFSNITECTFVYDQGGIYVEYDVSSLTNDYGPYVVMDRFNSNADDDASTNQFSYYFNICENVPTEALPSSAVGDTYCNSAAASFQVASQSETFCRTGGLLAGAEFTLLSDYYEFSPDPSMGVALTYSGGDTCGSGDDAKNRKTTILIPCSNTQNLPDTEEMQEADTGCVYILELPSQAGCPTQCPIGGSGREVCSGRGVCGFDDDYKQARCFCFEGAYGDDCGDDSAWGEEDTDVITAIFAVLFVFVILVLVGSVLMWRRVQSLRLDPKEYGNTTAAASTHGIEMEAVGLSGPGRPEDTDTDDDDTLPGTAHTLHIDEHDNVTARGAQAHRGQGQQFVVADDDEDGSSDEQGIDLGLQDEEMDDFI